MNYRVRNFIDNQYEKDDYTFSISDDGRSVCITDKDMNSMKIPMSVIYLIHKENELNWIKEYYEDEIEERFQDMTHFDDNEVQAVIDNALEALYDSALDDSDCISFIYNDLAHSLHNIETRIEEDKER